MVLWQMGDNNNYMLKHKTKTQMFMPISYSSLKYNLYNLNKKHKYTVLLLILLHKLTNVWSMEFVKQYASKICVKGWLHKGKNDYSNYYVNNL